MLFSRRRSSLLLSLLAGTALSSQAIALDPSGSVVRVTRIVDADGPGGARPLATEGPVFMGDQITTNPNGLAQIRFIDDTKIVVGPNSQLVVDSFVFNPDNTARDVTVSTVKGFFRFISGNSPSDAYRIRTPTMTIGIRGTVLDTQTHGAASRVVFHRGSGFGIDAQSNQTDFQGGCILYVAPSGGGFETPQGLQRQLQMSAYFPWVGPTNQLALDPDFRVDTSACLTADSRLVNPPPENDGSGPYQ